MRKWIAPGLLAALCSAAGAEEPPKPAPPQVKFTVPIVVQAGEEVKLTVRGTGLDGATAVRFAGAAAPITTTIESQAKAGPPNGLDVARAGDTELKLVLKLPDGVPPGEHQFVVVGQHGESRPQRLIVAAAGSVLDDKEPNDGFTQAQATGAPRAIRGTIERGQDVDVYAIRGTPGKRLVIDVTAARMGSPVDVLLTACDVRGRILATADDAEESRDPRLALELPPDGQLLLCVMEANDAGGPLHGYAIRFAE